MDYNNAVQSTRLDENIEISIHKDAEELESEHDPAVYYEETTILDIISKKIDSKIDDEDFFIIEIEKNEGLLDQNDKRQKSNEKVCRNSSNKPKTYMCDHCNYICYKISFIKRHLKEHSDKRLFLCQICEKVFKTNEHLLQHQTTHITPVFMCNLCGDQYQTSQELKHHNKTHSQLKNVFTCKSCGFMTFEKDNFKSHVPCFGDESKYVCLCGISFIYFHKLKDHVEKMHPGHNVLFCEKFNLIEHKEQTHNKCHLDIKTLYNCNVCEYSTPVSTYLKKHLIKHSDVRPFQCEKCQMNFKTKTTLVKHAATHKEFKCSVCQKVFQTLTALKNHIYMHEGITNLFTCVECGFLSSIEKDMEDHRSSHKDLKMYVCEECGLKFKYPIFLKRHQRKHEQTKVLYSCNKCSFFTLKSNNFNKHMQETHREFSILQCDKTEQQKKYKCLECDYSSDHFGNFNTHKKKHLSLDNRPKIKSDCEVFFCTQCNFSCNKIANLRNHQRSHVQGKPFFCDRCSFSCKLLKYLKQHELTHTKIKPFSCDLCSRSFRKMCFLKTHTSIHGLPSALHCGKCDYICNSPKTLKKHYKLHVS